jgi:melibiose permease/lactose/raffinose/galactose permease
MFLVYDLFFTMNDIAYWGMVPALASRKGDRDRLTSQAVLFAGIGGGLVGIVVPIFTAGERAIGGNALAAYRSLAVIFIALFLGGQLITLLGVKEKPLPPKGEATVDKVGLKTIVHTIRNNDQLLWILVTFLLASVGDGLVSNGLGMNYIFFEFGYDGLLYTIFTALGAVATGVVFMLFTPISTRFTRAQLMRTATLSILGGSAFMLLAGLLVPSSAGTAKFVLLMVANIFSFAGQKIYYLIIMISIANTVEYNEWKTGARAEGIIFSVRPFITKVGWAVINFLTLVIDLLTGVREYTNQISDFENAAAKGLSPEAKSDGIRAVLEGVPAGKNTALLACMTLIPAALALASYYLYKKKYSITEERYERILSDLKEREGTARG